MHFLHIRKTGGSAMKVALWPHEFSGPYHIALHSHSYRLSDVPEGEPFFFAVRDPISRFVSGFYSRQRQGGSGRPRPWRPREAIVYEQFSTPNELATALSSPDASEARAARNAIDAIEHLHSTWDWFGDERHLLSRRGDLLMVLFQDRLAEDFEILTQRLGVTATLPSDDVKAHRTASSADRRLSDEAMANLRDWYRRDYEFLDLCLRLRAGLTTG